MKKAIYLSILCCAIIFGACSSPKTPTAVAEKYLSACKAEKFDQAVALFEMDSTTTPEQIKALEAKMAAGMKEQGGIKSYEIIKDGETISADGKSATVKYKMTMGNDAEEKESEFKLNKVGDDWKIDLKSK